MRPRRGARCVKTDHQLNRERALPALVAFGAGDRPQLDTTVEEIFIPDEEKRT